MALTEIAIAMFNSPNPLGIQVGDVVEAREALGRIGQQDQRLCLWLVLEDLVATDRALLKSSQYVDPATKLILTRKARFNATTDRIRTKLGGTFDLLRAMSKDVVYQPALNLDERTGQFRASLPEIEARDFFFDLQENVLFDKRNGSLS